MITRVAINGFGRIGRAVVRSAIERDAGIEIVAVNDVADPATLAHLLKLDSVYGRFAPPVAVDGDVLAVGDRRILALAQPDPAALPWAELDVDVVIESTGKFRTRADAQRHLDAGARKVILSAPAKGSDGADANIVLGVNFASYDPERHHVVTNASWTTNCLAPVAKVLHEAVGIDHGLMTTIHAYTADQNLLDGPHKDPGARGTPARIRDPCAGPGRLDRRPDDSVLAPDERRRDQRGVRRSRRRADARHPGVLGGSDRLRRHRGVPGQRRRRRRADERHGRHDGQGHRLVRQ
jgi:glyceraldehyde-3-phosphate dehydrogenase/erythrose-4-phosphate dehydrogenase